MTIALNALAFISNKRNQSLRETKVSDNEIEKEIQAKGLTAPRVTPAQIEAVIAGEYYFTALDGQAGAADSEQGSQAIGASVNHRQPLSLLTFCVLVLKNGFTVTGESACASPENFNAELGRKIARQHAVGKVWPLEGYLLRQSLFDAASKCDAGEG
jgi:hypothetical protein